MTRRREGPGLGDIFSSWINQGENLPITPAQIQKVLGRGQIKDIAKQTGLSRGDTADALSQRFPQIVDKLTPRGTIEPESLMGDGLDTLKKIFG